MTIRQQITALLGVEVKEVPKCHNPLLLVKAMGNSLVYRKNQGVVIIARNKL